MKSVEVKLAAIEARVNTIRLDGEVLFMKTEPSGMYDRVSLYRAYGSDARISTNVLRLGRHRLGADWLSALMTILRDMAELRKELLLRQQEPAASAATPA